jgi:hypothetical protein
MIALYPHYTVADMQGLSGGVLKHRKRLPVHVRRGDQGAPPDTLDCASKGVA